MQCYFAVRPDAMVSRDEGRNIGCSSGETHRHCCPTSPPSFLWLLCLGPPEMTHPAPIHPAHLGPFLAFNLHLLYPFFLLSHVSECGFVAKCPPTPTRLHSLSFHNAVIQSQAPHKIFPSMRARGRLRATAVVPDHAAPSACPHGMAFWLFSSCPRSPPSWSDLILHAMLGSSANTSSSSPSLRHCNG